MTCRVCVYRSLGHGDHVCLVWRSGMLSVCGYRRSGMLSAYRPRRSGMLSEFVPRQ